MKKIIKIVIVIIIAGAIGGYMYLQFNKKKIVKDSIENAITKKTDSLYYVHYDSSKIDEINGNATFYNLVLQSDSAQKELLNSTDSLPNALYNVRVLQVSVTGVDIPGLLQKQNLAATKIELIKPVIQIINTGADNPRPFTMQDTVELYKKILGKFKSIRANTIQVTNGTLLITNKTGKAQTSFENINITLNNFLVDDTKNYENIASYFIKDVRATVENIQLPASKTDTRINLEKVDYNAAKKYLQISAIKQYKINNMNSITELKNIRINELNTDAFILQQQLKAGQITCDGGVITIYTSKKKGKAKAEEQTLELSTDMIDQAQIAGIDLKSTKVIIADKANPAKDPFVLNNVNFKVTKMLKVTEGNTLSNIINNAEWELSADGFSLNTKSKLYKMRVGDFVINNAASLVKIKNFLLTPLLTEQQFGQHNHFQKDQYNLVVNDIVLSGVNISKLISNKELDVENASLQPIIKIFNDRTLPPSGKSKVGNYPQQQIMKLPLPVYIHTVKINNASVSYRERAVKSKLIGNVFFTTINGTITNVTNIPERIKTNDLLKLNATAKFLGAGNLTTEWQFPLKTASNGTFKISGRMQELDAPTLNSILNPLAMASIKEGKIDEVAFSMDGTNYKAIANILFLYHDLKLDVLKKDEEADLKKRGLVSLLANAIIKNDNTNKANSKQINNDRDTTRSFFNLVWKTIYAGAKNTALGKK
ncbi:MAG: hypothetical protein JWP81_1302 [Ferruginibacter sp.]|nr:hypothetical protein [Ferruginibacter sp.]